MSQKTNILLPKAERILKTLGENIRLARLRRNITLAQEAERANVSVLTLNKIERGSPSVAMGNYMQVLFTLGFEEDLLKVASDDELGRKLQDLGLSTRRRASKRSAKL